MAQGPNWSTLSQFTWGTNLANTLEVGYPLHEVNAYSSPREKNSILQSRGGGMSSWSYGHDQFLEATVIAIPQVDGNSQWDSTLTRTGWEGDTGWEAFFEWAYQKLPIFFVPDRTVPTIRESVYVDDPWRTAPEAGWLFHRDVKLKLRSGFLTYTVVMGDAVIVRSLTVPPPFVGY